MGRDSTEEEEAAAAAAEEEEENRPWEEIRPCNHAAASQPLLERILQLHASGRAAEEIAAQILTAEPENVRFRAALLVEIILHYSGACLGGREQ